MNRNHLFSLLASTLSLALVNCQPMLQNSEYTNPDSVYDGSPKLELSQPMAPDGLHTLEAPTVGKVMHVDASMFSVGPGVCDSGIMGTDCSNETDTAVAFQVLSAECDEDACIVNGIDDGDATHPTTITITPLAEDVRLNVTGVSGALEAAGGLEVFPNTMREASTLKKVQ